MITRLFAVLALSALLTTQAGFAQTHQHQHPDPGSMSPRPIPPVQYTFRGEIKPESTLVRGLLEVEYTNTTNDSLHDIRFFSATPILDPYDTITKAEPPYLKLDSVLLYGVPLTDSELVIDAHRMAAVMTRPLPPKERAFFIMTFETRLTSSDPDGVTFTDWYPKVSTYHDGRWYDQYDSVLNQAVPEFADFAVALQIDSAYSLVYPGELINDKEHYGLLPLPNNDSVYVDIVNQHQQEYAGIKYKPTFEGGVKRFFIRSKNDIDFSFVAGRQLIRDRAYVDSLTIEVCYPPRLSEVWAGFVAAEAACLVRRLEERLGTFPYQNLRVGLSDGAPIGVDSRQLLVLPPGVMDTLLLGTMMAVQLSQCWCAPVLPVEKPEDALFGEGLAYYVVMPALSDVICDGCRTPTSGFDLCAESVRRGWYKAFGRLHDYEKWLLTRSQLQPYANYSRLDTISAGSATVELAVRTPLRRVPTVLHTLDYVVGSELLWNAVRNYVSQNLYRYTTPHTFEQSVLDVTEHDLLWFFDEWNRPDPSCDFAIINVDSSDDKDAHDVVLTIGNKGNLLLPIEITTGGIIERTTWSQDTMLTHDFLISGGPQYTIHLSLKAPARYIVIDMRGHLPDRDRSSNLFQAHQSPGDVIITIHPPVEFHSYTDLRSVLDD